LLVRLLHILVLLLLQLKTINDATSGAITLADTNGTLSGSASDLVDAFDGTITGYEGNITVTGTTSTAVEIDAIAALTTGAVTATITGAQLGDASGLSTIESTDYLSVIDLSGLAVTATDAAVDTFVFDDADTGVTINLLSVNDVLDFSADIAVSLIAHGSDTDGDNTTVDAAGEWSYTGTTFTYWNGTAAQTVSIDAGLTLSTTGTDEVVTIIGVP